ncbi:MAG: hypothetical protein AB7L09_02975 [Nitrospira sp.]
MSTEPTIPGDWKIGVLDIKPGNILLLRLHIDSNPGMIRTLQQTNLATTMDKAKLTVRAALDSIGLTHDKVPLLVTTDQWDLLLIRPLDLLDACTTAAKNEPVDPPV